MEEIKLIYTENDFLRIDKFLSNELKEFTRTQLQMMIDEKLVLVNDKEIKSNYKLKINDEITVFIKEPELTDIEPEDIPLDVIYEDKDIIVINKPSGMVVHPALGNYSGTLVNALMYHCKDLSGINGKIRAGIVHRIDKDTSGLLIIAKNDKAHINMSEQIKNHEVKIKNNKTKEENIISTSFKTLKALNDISSKLTTFLLKKRMIWIKLYILN